MNQILQNKLKKLQAILHRMGHVLVAYSGGVDSTFLLKVAAEVLPGRVLAVTVDSASFPAAEKDAAERLSRDLGIKLKVIKINELNNPGFVANQKDRCYWCKKELFSKLKEMAKKEKLNFVLDGSNADDVTDYRPGTKALRELGIRRPLKEAGLTKNEIRQLSGELKLPTWNKPAMACLASRIPYKTKITGPLLKKIDRAENYLKKFGLKQVRVRHHGPLARIEILGSDLPRLIPQKVRGPVNEYFKKLGYLYVTLDLQGYRTGSLNEVL